MAISYFGKNKKAAMKHAKNYSKIGYFTTVGKQRGQWVVDRRLKRVGEM